MSNDKGPIATLTFDQIAKSVICNIVEENGQLFAIVTEGRAGPLCEPVRILLDQSHLQELKGAPLGSPQYRYWSQIPLPKEIL
jgi:hypothetical protein